MTNTITYSTLVQKKDEIFYVYVYLDPRKPGKYFFGNLSFNFEPFYVGKGKNNRIIDGLSNKRESRYKISKINKIKESNLEVIILKIYENMNEKDAFLMEIDSIKKIGRKIDNGPLCNFHIGGTGGDNFSNHFNKELLINKWKQTRTYNIENKITIVSEETKQKMRDFHKKKKELNITYYKPTDEVKKKISIGNLGKLKPKTDEHKLKLRDVNLGKIRSKESKEKQSETCKETLSKIKDKLSEKSKGIKNSNSKKFIIQLNNTLEIIEILGANNLLDYYNDYSNSVYKDSPYLVKKLKENKLDRVKLIDIININHKINNK